MGIDNEIFFPFEVGLSLKELVFFLFKCPSQFFIFKDTFLPIALAGLEPTVVQFGLKFIKICLALPPFPSAWV